ncbi:MAG: flagellar M-ring protein FliF [Magnetococcales bacterium]|nr:flagellar M-ring protein FliF [Magnetococcales bacterium]
MAEATKKDFDDISSEDEGVFAKIMGGLPVLAGRNGLIVALGATIIALAAIIWLATRPAYKVLFSGLPEEEAARVVEELTKKNIPHELTAGGGTIKVPGDRVYNLRLEMATMGLPKKVTGIGFEIFDQHNLVGMTDFMQRMNYQRALQGELARTIENIAAVQKARVHLVLPKRSLFVNEEQKASASVVMDVKQALSQPQINGIVHLIASAVEGLDESNITLTDQKGNMLAGGKKEDAGGRLAPDEGLGMQKKVERTLEERVQTMLDRVLGPDRSIIRVTADLDLSRVERQEEKFDPEGQVARSEQFVNENSNGVFGVGGVPGVQPNDANANSGNGSSGSSQNRLAERETVNYEISKTVNRTLLPVGTIRRLSVAVLVDGTYEPSKEEGKPMIYKAREPEEITRLQRIIEQAVGFRQDRGDTIQVTNTAFDPIRSPEAMETTWLTPEFQLEMAKYLTVLILLTLVILYVLRPLVKKLMVPEKLDEDQLPGTVAELERQLLAAGVGSVPSEKPLRVLIPDRTAQLAQQLISEHLEEAREVIRGWMMQDN